MQPNFYIEQQFGSKVIGIDEAGRGPLAGPVVAAAVILPRTQECYLFNDSKKLSVKKRQHYYNIIMRCALVGVGIIDNVKIDQLNILQATLLAMREAVAKLDTNYDHIIVDGNISPFPNNSNVTPIIKGDSKSLSIAAASIVAKVTRDNIMQELALQYPHYGWEKNQGYGTKLHIEGIKKYGICEFHRLSFTKHLIAKNI